MCLGSAVKLIFVQLVLNQGSSGAHHEVVMSWIHTQ